MRELIPAATRLTAALADVAAAALDLPPEQIKNTPLPLACLENRLTSLAEERHTDVWERSWPTLKKRQVADEALRLKFKKGTLGYIHHHLALIGARAYLREWWQQQPKARPYTFVLGARASEFRESDEPLTGDMLRRMGVVVEATKPLSRTFGTEMMGDLGREVHIVTHGRGRQIARFAAHFENRSPLVWSGSLLAHGRAYQVLNLRGDFQ